MKAAKTALCPSCRKTVPAAADRCTHCGKPIRNPLPGAPEQEKPRRRKAWPRIVVVVAVVAAIGALLAVFGPDGATYEEYLQLKEGMSRQEVADIIGDGDYWYHNEGDNLVTSWVNDKDGTYIRAVFDKADVLVEVSWESGWNPDREGGWEWE